MSALADAMDFVLFIGAARHDANAEQLTRLRDEVLPLVPVLREKARDAKAFAEVERQIRLKVAEVMGADWRPGDDWKLVKD